MCGTKSLVAAAILGCASLLLLPEPAQAAGGVSVGVGVGVGGPNFYFYAGPRSYGYGPYSLYSPYGRYGYNPYYFTSGRYYGYGTYPYYQYTSGIMLPPLPARQSYYYSPPATPYYYAPPAQPAPPANNTARVQINVPDPNASIWFDGQPTQQAGTVRNFDTPPLEAGKAYTYKITASWTQGGQQLTQERTVRVTPGYTSVVDFTRPAN